MVKVGRYINGIYINGFEYLLTDDGQIMLFEDKSFAQKFLLEHGIPEDTLDFYSYIEVDECNLIKIKNGK